MSVVSLVVDSEAMMARASCVLCSVDCRCFWYVSRLVAKLFQLSTKSPPRSSKSIDGKVIDMSNGFLIVCCSRQLNALIHCHTSGTASHGETPHISTSVR